MDLLAGYTIVSERPSYTLMHVSITASLWGNIGNIGHEDFFTLKISVKSGLYNDKMHFTSLNNTA